MKEDATLPYVLLTLQLMFALKTSHATSIMVSASLSHAPKKTLPPTALPWPVTRPPTSA